MCPGHEKKIGCVNRELKTHCVCVLCSGTVCQLLEETKTIQSISVSITDRSAAQVQEFKGIVSQKLSKYVSKVFK